MAQIFSNQARVTFSYEGSEVSHTNDSNIVNSTMKDRYDFSVEKSATSDCFRPGDRVNFFVNITNTGCGCLGMFRVSDNLGGDGYLTYVEGSARLFVNGSMTTIVPTTASPLEFEISSDLAKEGSLVLQYSADVSGDVPADVLSITNEVTVVAGPYGCGCGCNGSSNNTITKTATFTLEKCEFAEVLITKSVSSDSVCCDDEIDYFITLTNIGTIDATNVVVTDSLPTGFTLTEVHSENNGVHYKYDASEYTIDSSNVLTLPNAAGRIILVQALAPGVENTTRIRLHGHMWFY